MRLTGKIIKWNEQKGYGFVKPDSNAKELFIHINEFDWRPEQGQKISFVVGRDKQGRPCAQNAILYGDYLKQQKGTSISYFWSVFIALFLITMIYLLESGLVTIWVVPVYVLMSLLSFSLYWYDKDAAQRKAWRLPENMLHLIDFSGGWIGAILAQQRYRHKTKKLSFRIGFWLSVVLNLGMLYLISQNQVL